MLILMRIASVTAAAILLGLFGLGWYLIYLGMRETWRNWPMIPLFFAFTVMVGCAFVARMIWWWT